MSDRDAFREGQGVTERHRSGLDEVREDVRAIVRDEVTQAGLSESDLERLVGRLVAKHLAAREEAPRPSWSTPLGIVGLMALGVVLGSVGYGAIIRAGSGAELLSPDTVTSESAQPPAAQVDPPAATPVARTPEERATAFDSLFEARSGLLTPVVSELAASAIAAPVSEAIVAWNEGSLLTAGQRRRLHDGLVQLVVSQLSGVGLSLDGLVTRGPCSGASCGALLTLWQSRGAELGLPTFPEDAPNNTAALAQAERLILLSKLDGWDG